MYKYMEEGFNLEKAPKFKTTVEKELLKSTKYIADIFNIIIIQRLKASKYFKSKIYYLLDSYTETPTKIFELMEEKEKEIKDIIEKVTKDICNTPEKKKDIEWDIKNTVEKYFSITYPDEKIFTNGRNAYPLRLTATDEDDSTVTQRSGNSRPLQSRDIFFDNKRMLQRNKICDGVTFMFSRKKQHYFSDYYQVAISTNKEYCLVKFTTYTKEEDIENVLFSIINAEPKKSD